MKKIASIFLGMALIFGLTAARSFANTDDSKVTRVNSKKGAKKPTVAKKKAAAKKSTAKM